MERHFNSTQLTTSFILAKKCFYYGSIFLRALIGHFRLHHRVYSSFPIFTSQEKNLTHFRYQNDIL